MVISLTLVVFLNESFDLCSHMFVFFQDFQLGSIS
jgi:hypothetical protein